MREDAKDSRPPTSPSSRATSSSPRLLQQPPPHAGPSHRDPGSGRGVKTHHPRGTQPGRDVPCAAQAIPSTGQECHHPQFMGEPEQRRHQPIHTPVSVSTPWHGHKHFIFHRGLSPEHASMATARPVKTSCDHPFISMPQGAHLLHAEAFTPGPSVTLHPGLSSRELAVKHLPTPLAALSDLLETPRG